MAERWATFDCYGTLIDWDSGIRGALAGLWPSSDADALLRLYHQLEPAGQAGRAVPYRQVLAETLAGVASIAGLAVPAGAADALGQSLPAWPVFPEVRRALTELRKAGWRLAILSNTDPDLLDGSLRAIRVPVDERLVASEVGAYKPSLRIWQAFFERTGATRSSHIHVAASLFHDVEPCARLGLRCAWVNRLGERSELPRTAEMTDLRGLAGRLEAIVPA